MADGMMDRMDQYGSWVLEFTSCAIVLDDGWWRLFDCFFLHGFLSGRFSWRWIFGFAWRQKLRLAHCVNLYLSGFILELGRQATYQPRPIKWDHHRKTIIEQLKTVTYFFFPETASEKMFQMVIGNGYGILFNLTPTKPTVVSTQDK